MEKEFGGFNRELEISERVFNTTRIIEQILAGETENVAEGDEDLEALSGVILDLNDESLSETKTVALVAHIEDLLGCPLGEVPIRARLVTGNGMTGVIIYEADLGGGEMAEDWRIARMKNEGEKPSYVMMRAVEWELNVESGVYRLVEGEI